MRPSPISSQQKRPPYFNPRTHVGCDIMVEGYNIAFKLFQSTHPRGVRLNLFFKFLLCLAISIHAPTWGATPCFFKDPLNSSNFNPRTHVGCDCSLLVVSPHWAISIHAPTWGATKSVLPSSIALLFQSTHPRGVRRKNRGNPSRPSDFNPRTHVGCDIRSDQSF